jgi:hypothetical protein
MQMVGLALKMVQQTSELAGLQGYKEVDKQESAGTLCCSAARGGGGIGISD